MSDCTRTEERLVDFLEDDLRADVRDEITAHLDGCSACRDTVRSYRAIQEAYREVPDRDVSVDTAMTVLAAAGSRRARPLRPRRLVLEVAALFLLALIPLVLEFAARKIEPSADPVAELVKRGDERCASKDWDEAEEAYEQALALATERERARIEHRLGSLEAVRGELPEALAHLARVIELDPGYGDLRDVLLLKADVLGRLGRKEQAIETYHSVAREYPGSWDEVTRRLQELEGRVEMQREALEALRGLGYVGGD